MGFPLESITCLAFTYSILNSIENNINFIYLPMDLLSILLIAIALSMDAFAVSVAGGMAMKRHALKMALSFGSFQAIMPII